MKQIDLSLRDKISSFIVEYKNYIAVNNWLIRFTSEPEKVMLEIEETDSVLFEKLVSVNKGLGNQALKFKAMEIGLKVLSGQSVDVYKGLKEKLDFIFNKENNPLIILGENTELIFKDVNSEQLEGFITRMMSSLAMKEYATNKIDNIVTPLSSEDTNSNVNYDVWLTRLVNSFSDMRNEIPSELLTKIDSLKQLDVFVDKKVKLIKTSLKESTRVTDGPEGNINEHTECVKEDLSVPFTSVITDATEETMVPVDAVKKLVALLTTAIYDFEKISIDKDKVMLEKSSLTTNLNLINKFSKDFTSGEELAEDFSTLLSEVHNTNTIVIERLEKFIGELINESIKLNYNANMFMHLNNLLERILTEAVIK